MSENTAGLFFDRIWGDGIGQRCVALGNAGMKHLWGDSNKIVEAPTERVNLFFGAFVFTRDTRKQVYAATTRAFWVDVDVKPGIEGAYESLEAAIGAFREFLHTSAFLPPTYIVKSGAGLHIYWCLTENIDAALWKRKALVLKNIFASSGFLAGPERTADAASLMRVPGTTNKKEGRDPLSVEILYTRGVIDNDNFYKALDSAGKTSGAVVKKTKPETKLDALQGSMLAVDVSASDKYDADIMASNCAQVGHIRATRGAVSEPLWYAGVQVIRFTKNGNQICHAWSTGDDRYSRSATDAKIAQLEKNDIGPTTCEQFARVGSASLCKDCVHRGVVKSPIQVALGVVELDEDVETIKFAGADIPIGFVPDGFFLSSDGGLAFKHPETGMAINFYPYPLFVSNRVLNDDGSYIMTVDTWLPRDGYNHIQMPMSVCKDQALLTEELAAHGVVCNDSEDKMLRMYIVESVRQLTKNITAIKGYTRYGWVDGVFYLHGYSFDARGTHEARFTGEHDMSGEVGNFDAWGDVFKHYEEAPITYKAAFYAGLAAPLMEFTGLSGLTYSMVSSESGVGKTTVQSVVCALYGDPELMRAQRTDTYNSLMKRLGILNSLPMCVDEMTNIEGGDLSEFVYQVSQGREKSRLTKTSSMQDAGQWSTIVISSSNEMMTAKIRANRIDGEAELSRLIELYAPAYAPKSILDKINHTVRANYGTPGAKWAAFIAANKGAVQRVLKDSMDRIELQAPWGTSGRFYTAFVAALATAGELTKQVFGRSFNEKAFVVSLIHAITENKERANRVSIDRESMLSYAKTEVEVEAVKKEIAIREAAMGTSSTAWKDALLAHCMRNSFVRHMNGSTTVPSVMYYRIDEFEGKLYIPMSEFQKVLIDCGISSMSTGDVKYEDHAMYSGTTLATSVRIRCAVIDILAVQNKLSIVSKKEEAPAKQPVQINKGAKNGNA